MFPRTLPGIAIALAAVMAAGAEQAPSPSPAPSEDEKAIRAVDEAFVRDYNKGDAKALAALFTEDAEAIEAEGDRCQGREQIEHLLARTFAASPGVKLALEIDSIRFLSPDVAREEGRSVATPARGTPLARVYTVLWVRRGDRWLISSVREEGDSDISPHERLKVLEGLIGEWIDEGADSVVRLDCRWSDDGNFLIRTFTVKREGRPVLGVTQRIGWDPVARHIRSWEFDSEGGFGEGRWSRDRDGLRWIIKHTGVLPEGTIASATNIMILERPDLMRWAATDRIVGEDTVPSEESYVLVRVPPRPGRAHSAPAPAPRPESPAPSPRPARNQP
jgi:uncharacterized protein (TIGR02246 family)